MLLGKTRYCHSASLHPGLTRPQSSSYVWYEGEQGKKVRDCKKATADELNAEGNPEMD